MANLFIAAIVSMVIGLIMTANVFFPTYKGANTTGWNSSELSLWNVLGLSVIIGLVVGAFNMFGLI
jgi:hypothetical protein